MKEQLETLKLNFDLLELEGEIEGKSDSQISS